MKENNLFKDEFKVLMDTIKNLQNEILKNKSEKISTQNSELLDVETQDNLKEINESRQLKRKYKFMSQENERIKSMNKKMKDMSKNDFSKIVEANTYYKMLNQELQEYILTLKGDLDKETSRSVNLKSKINQINRETDNVKNMITDFKIEIESLENPHNTQFEKKSSFMNHQSKYIKYKI